MALLALSGLTQGCDLNTTLTLAIDPLREQNKLSIETQPDGSGTLLSKITLTPGQEFIVYSVFRDGYDTYVSTPEVSWTLAGNIGTLTISISGNSATFKALQPGTGLIKSLGQDGTATEVNIEVNNGTIPADPTLALSDPTTLSSNYIRQNTVALNIGNDVDIVKWCVSETQITKPASSLVNCDGGQGPELGWHTARPSSLSLTAAEELKNIYLWVANTSNTVNETTVFTQIELDNTALPAPTIDAKDPITLSDTDTYSSGVSLTISGDAGATEWCVLEGTSLPTQPAFDNPCFSATTPPLANLSSTGLRSLYLYVKDAAENVSLPGTDSITYTTNDNPVAVTDTIYLSMGSSFNFDPKINDTDAQNDALEITAVTDGSSGTVINEADDTLTYTPTSGIFYGTDSFTYTISDGRGGATTGSINVHVVTPYTWIDQDGDGLWSQNNNWCGTVLVGACQFDLASPPGITDVVVFDDTCINCDVSMDSSPSLLGIDIKTGYSGVITQAAGQSFTVGNSGFSMAAGEYDASLATANIAITGLGNLNLSGGIFKSTSTILSIAGNATITNSSTFFDSGGTLEFTSTNDISVNIFNGVTLNNLTFSKSGSTSITIVDEISVDGNLVVTNDANTQLLGSKILVKSDIAMNANGGGTTIITVIGTLNQNISGLGWFPSFEIDKALGTAVFTGNIYFSKIYRLIQGASDYSAATVNFVGGTSSIYGTGISFNDMNVIQLNNGALYMYNDITVLGNLVLNTPGYGATLVRAGIINLHKDLTVSDWAGNYYSETATIALVGTGTQNISGPDLFPRIKVDKTSGIANFLGSLMFNTSYEWAQGTTDFSGSTVTFGNYVGYVNSGATVFDNVNLGNNKNYNFDVYGDFIVGGNLIVNMGVSTALGNDGGGDDTIFVAKNVDIQSSGISLDVNLTFNGGGLSQVFSVTQEQKNFSGLIKIDNGSTLDLASDINFLDAGHNVHLSHGTLNLNSYNLTNIATFYIRDAIPNTTTLNRYPGRLFYDVCEDSILGTNAGACPGSDATASPYTWMGKVDSNWSNKDNWCGSLNAGLCQYDLVTAPNASDGMTIAIFDSNCQSEVTCDTTISSNITLDGISMKSTYTGVLSMTNGAGATLNIHNGKFVLSGGAFNPNDNTVTTTSNLEILGGNFNSKFASLSIFGDYIQTGGTFESPAGIFSLGDGIATGNISYSGGIFNHNNGVLSLGSSCYQTSGHNSNTAATINTPSGIDLYDLTVRIKDTASYGSWNGCHLSVLDGPSTYDVTVNNTLTIHDGELRNGNIKLLGDLVATCTNGNDVGNPDDYVGRCTGTDPDTYLALDKTGDRTRGGGSTELIFANIGTPQYYDVHSDALLAHLVIETGAAVSQAGAINGFGDIRMAKFKMNGGSFTAPSSQNFKLGYHRGFADTISQTDGFIIASGATFDYNGSTLYFQWGGGMSSNLDIGVIDINPGADGSLTLGDVVILAWDRGGYGGYDDPRIVINDNDSLIVNNLTIIDGMLNNDGVNNGSIKVQGNIDLQYDNSIVDPDGIAISRPEGGTASIELIGSGLQTISKAHDHSLLPENLIISNSGAGVQLLSNLNFVNPLSPYTYSLNVTVNSGALDINNFSFDSIDSLLLISPPGSILLNGGSISYISCPNSNCP